MFGWICLLMYTPSDLLCLLAVSDFLSPKIQITPALILQTDNEWTVEYESMKALVVTVNIL